MSESSPTKVRHPWIMISSGSPNSSRRISRRPACTPCRVRKLACDRSEPVCKRCRKARRKLNCVYPSSTSPLGTSINGPELVSEANSATETRSRTAPRPLIDVASDSGYFGYTSHNNVFEETQLDLFLANGSTSQQGSAERTEGNNRRIAFRELQPPIRESALFVLRCLPVEQMASQKSSSDLKGWVNVAIDRIIQSLQATLKNPLHQGDEGLSALAEILCNNTRRPIKEESHDAEQWISQFCDKNLRWESIGLFWAGIARISDDVDSLRSHHVESLAQQMSPETARTCLGYCIELARTFIEGNEVLLDLCRRKSVLDSIIDGDARISSFVSHSLAVTMLTYLGFHDLENGPSYRPTLCSEYRRRLVAQIFTTDKFGVSFAGRPPSLTGTFCSTPMPLDISDEDLASDDVTLMRAFNSLDDHGWNTAGEIYPTTMIRARHMIAVIRDELINIALCKRRPVDPNQLQEIKTRQMASMSTLPEWIKYNLEDLADSDVDAKTLYFRITLQLDYLKNTFFVERLLHRHGQSDKRDLAIPSFDLVKLTVELWKRQSSLDNPVILREFEWQLLEYGAPGGGILCQELLQPTPAGSNPRYTALTRSAIVQQLSLLVGFLDWVPASAPAGESCANFKHLIQRVLDHHLNEPDGLEGRGNLETLGWGSLLPPPFRFGLLNSFDWLGPSV